jgi:hypothetical protein
VALTPEQLEVWGNTKPKSPKPRGGQTPEHAYNMAIWSFKQACAFEGAEVPSDEDVAEALTTVS